MGVVRRVARGTGGSTIGRVGTIPATGNNNLIAADVMSDVTGTVLVGLTDGLN